MLALKTVLAQHDKIPLLVFDEVDMGIGGHTAVRVGEALKALSRHHQVIVITHLHQVAAGASVHFQVSKSADRGRTAVMVRRLEEDERVDELARMMGGGDSESSLQHARQLLDQA
jgi:DNA repair protein RecN (Recombination protein N)